MTFKVGDYGWVWDGIQWTSWRSLNPDRDHQQQKPLLGFTLFIWIKRLKLDEAELLRNIQVLGGRVSEFLDEAVSFVVTDQDPTKVTAAPKTPEEQAPRSRGQLILSRAHKAAEAANAEDCVIDRVREARIRLWNISQFLRWVEVQLNIQPSASPDLPAATGAAATSRKRKASRLPRPLVKVEDFEQEFKPVYKVFKSDPSLYINSLYPSSPFDDPAVQERYVQHKKAGRGVVPSADSDCSDKETDVTATANKPQQQGAAAAAAPAAPPPPAKHQYCECCNAYFYNLQQHIGPDGAHHREFALRDDNFECVKELIDCFPSLDEFVGNGDHGIDKVLADMHPSAYHFAMLNAAGMQASAAAAAYHRPPPMPFPTRPAFDPGQVMVKQEPQEDSPPSAMHHSGLLSGVGEAGAAVPLDFSRTSQLSEICGQSFPREYVHHHAPPAPPPPLIPHPPYLPDKTEEPQSCWMGGGGAKMDPAGSGAAATAATMPPPPPHLSHHSQGVPPVSSSHHLPLENLSFLDPPQQDAMFTSELPQPDFSFGLQNLLHSICDETEDENGQRRSSGSRSIDSHKENLEKAAESATAPASLIPQPQPQQQQQQQQPYPMWPYSEPASMASENTRCQQQPSMENSSSSPLELTAHMPSEAPPSSASKQTAARRRHSRDDEDATSNGMSESNPNRWTVERTRRGVGLKLKFTPARKQSSSLMSPPTPVHTTPRTPKAAKSAGGGSGGASSSFDVYDWNEEEEGECSEFVKVQWRVMHTEDTKVILCRTKQFALPRKHGKGVGGKQLVY